MLSSIHHRPLPLCSLLLAPILLLAGCSTRNERESLKDTVLDDYSYAIYNFRCEIRRPLTKEAVNSYKWGEGSTDTRGSNGQLKIYRRSFK